MNGWNLQPSPMKRKENVSEANLHDYVPAVKFPEV